MFRIPSFLLLMLLVSRPSPALELRWSDGSTALTFASATRCTLVLRADPSQGQLPPEWRLLWVADSSGITFVADEPLQACETDTARVYSLEPPATAADSAAHREIARFCSAGSPAASIARFMLEQPGGSKGRLKIVALDPTDPDSTRVMASNEVTYNGGVVAAYPPVVLRASSVHQSLQLRVTAVGAGLNSANSMSIVALDSSWTLPLKITAQSDGSVTGAASVAALLPACQASVGAASGAISAASLPADEEPLYLEPQSCQAQYHEAHPLAPPPGLGFAIQPKDFAFVRGFVDDFSNRYALHLFYIRKNMWYTAAQNDLNEKRLGHSWTTNLNSWTLADTTFFEVRSGKFDELHVWAPTIVQRGPTFYMFYTGAELTEDNKRHQRIGVATSTDLNTWTRADTVVLSAPQVPWAKKDPQDVYGGAQQLRDPFVMEDPVNPGQWLMYFVAVDSLTSPRMAVGVARSNGDFGTWVADDEPLRSTQRSTFNGTTTVVESPHVFRRNGQWWLPYTVNQDTVFFETTTGADPTDPDTTSWSSPIWLRGVAEGQPPTLKYWHATEYLRINSTEYLAAYDDNAISIDIKGIFVPSSPESAAVDSFFLHCPEVAGIANRDDRDDGVRLAISRLRWGASEVRLRLEMPSRMAVKLTVYDIAGRCRSTLLDGEAPAGVTEVVWNGRDPDSGRVASGVYFARLTYTNGTRVSKFVMLR